MREVIKVGIKDKEEMANTISKLEDKA